MVIQKRRKYDADFKRSTVLLSLEPGRTIREIADNLGIHVDLIYQWRKKYEEQGEIAFPGNGIPALTAEQKKIKALEKELKNITMERDILKKAMAIFSRTQ
ncbi:related to transposase [Desulfotalea psychrophila LSv54]|uniref:Related to transposase n=1 Tax=Desulfotalea psychrophila (strain LSv54 / DSM 12343) TaxID=177439 RepID=Q6AMI3_DESPS|nr:related to transposase [Desulfotalea psychrophila LSv54]